MIAIFSALMSAETYDWMNYPMHSYIAGRGGAFLMERSIGNCLYNPSVTALLKGSGASFSSGLLAFGRTYFHLNGCYRLQKNVSLLGGFTYGSIGGFTETNAFGDKLGDFSVQRMMFFGGFSYRFGRAPVTGGFLFKYFTEDNYTMQGYGYGLKLVLSAFLRSFSIGVFADNIVQAVFWDDAEESYPFVFGLSAEKAIGKKLRLAAVVQSDPAFELNYRFGADYAFTEKFSAGIGSNGLNITAGVSFFIKDVKVHYSAQIERGFSGFSNFVSFDLNIGGTR